MNFFGPLQALRETPIPDLVDAKMRRKGSRQHPIDTQNALYNEPLIDLATLGIDGLNHYFTAANPPYYQKFAGSIAQLFLRESAAGKLAQIDATLRATGLKLFVHDAYRPTEVQAYAHDVWMPAQLQKKHPELSGAALVDAVEQYWAAPTKDASSPAPHQTGGAVDLTIAFRDGGQALFIGTIAEDVSALAHTDSFEARAQSESYSDQEAIANRRLLYWLMEGAGFANNPNEWWHFSYGDQMWAKLTGALAALYGVGVPPSPPMAERV